MLYSYFMLSIPGLPHNSPLPKNSPFRKSISITQPMLKILKEIWQGIVDALTYHLILMWHIFRKCWDGVYVVTVCTIFILYKYHMSITSILFSCGRCGWHPCEPICIHTGTFLSAIWAPHQCHVRIYLYNYTTYISFFINYNLCMTFSL